MTLKTWSFSKKKNSTARPVGSSRDYTVYMKENTSIERPVFIIGSGIDAGINYCQFSGNYYFIDDIELLSKDQVALHCSIDVLATHKIAIGNYTGFVKRSSNTSDAYLYDDAISVDQHIVSETMATTDIFTADQDGCFIVRCVSPSSDSPTGIASFVMSHREIGILLDFITDDDNAAFADIIDDAVTKAFFNPFQYILSIMWFPISRNSISGQDATLRLGWWDVPYESTPGSTSWKELTGTGIYQNVAVSKPTRYYTNDFRANSKQFTEVKAYIPGLGVVDIPPIALEANLHAEVSLDFVTGQLIVAFYDRGSQGGVTVNRDCFGSFSSQLGVPIQCGQTGTLETAAAFNSWGIAGEAIRIPVQAVSLMGKLVGGILRDHNGESHVYGSTGNMVQVMSHPRLIMYQRAYGCADAPNAVYGRPLCRNRQLSTIPGFIQCEAASISLAAPDTETEEVNNYLNSGFYYE